MTITEQSARGESGHTAEAEAKALFEEARRRRRRRYAWGALMIIPAATGLIAGVLLTTDSGGIVAPTRVGTPGPAGANHHTVRTVTLGESFAPRQVLTASGKVWVVGSTHQGGSECAIEEVDPTSLHTRIFPLPACGLYFAVGNGRIFMAVDAFTSATDSNAFHIESFVTASHRAVVLNPVDIATTGTGYAHMALAYGGGSLWLHPWGDEVLQISPTTGAVVRTITDAPFPGGGHPVVVASRSGIWLTGGVGSPPIIDRLTPGSLTASRIYRGPSPDSILGLVVAGDRVWARVATYGKGGRSVTIRLAAFDAAGRKVLETGVEKFGYSPLVGSDDQLWSVAAGPGCTGPQRLWRIDGRTGRSVVVATWPSPVVPCPTVAGGGSQLAGGTQLALAEHGAFVLDPTDSPGPSGVLFRIAL